MSSCIKDNGIFLFENLTPIHKKISNWFIYSEKEHYLINKWIIAALNYYDSLPQQYKDIYFIFHDIFEHLCEEDAVFLDYFEGAIVVFEQCYSTFSALRHPWFAI